MQMEVQQIAISLNDDQKIYKCRIVGQRHFSQLISANQQNPRILFNTINHLVNSPPPTAGTTFPANSNKNLTFLIISFLPSLDVLECYVTHETLN